MPIYGYKCQACGHEFELMLKMSDPAPSTCPACGKPDLRKQLSAAGFQLKGSGWYATDFKGGNNKTAEKKVTDKDSSKDSAAAKDSSGSKDSSSSKDSPGSKDTSSSKDSSGSSTKSSGNAS